ncbi:alpha-catulin-like isoform X2 [Brachionus plicatilis]|uniref:Alpha-catulin-like isoform X2 n=1 Tax=Brachionus plicatilis TaxID=10195 RepID=A0A3M7RUI8_BRAPC|nr:alpha-catulin-like isoform X2 [Brachionus plicatilis]
MATECSSNQYSETTSEIKFTDSNNNLNDCECFRIKTKSIENTLLPLVSQITTLINFKDNLKRISQNGTNSCSERTAKALCKVGETVNLAIERFVSVGESIAYENESIRYEMLEACREARVAGQSMRSQTQTPDSIVNVLGVITTPTNAGSLFSDEKVSMIHSANQLLNSVTKVLLLADIVIIKQILNSKNKVAQSLIKLENCYHIYSFVNLFSQYGADLIDLAHLSGERQNDLKDEKRKSQMSSTRWILEKSTVMILSSFKAYLKHPECQCAKENVNLVFSLLQQALETLHFLIVNSGSLTELTSPLFPANYAEKFSPSFTYYLRQFEDALELAKNDMLNEKNDENVLEYLNMLIESTHDFTNSVNICQREDIYLKQNEIRQMTVQFSQPNQNDLVESARPTASFILKECESLKKILIIETLQLTNQLFRRNQDAILLNSIKTYSFANQYDLLVETLDTFKEYSDHVLEICRMLRHICNLDVFEVTCEHHHSIFEFLAKLIQSASGAVALYPECKSSVENLNLFCDYWENQINDLSVLVKEIQENFQGGKQNKSVYLSLPRPGKHGANIRGVYKPVDKLDSNERSKIAKLGLEMKLIQSEIDNEADKWNQPQNEIVKLAKIMSETAYEIHLFTRGEGSLRTTQDLFEHAQGFLSNGILLYGVLKEFVSQVPDGYLKDELVHLLERLPFNFKQLKNKLKQVTVGKTATFNKVDCVIQDTRDFMNLVAKIVTNCFLCTTKYNINYEMTESAPKIQLRAKNNTRFCQEPVYSDNFCSRRAKALNRRSAYDSLYNRFSNYSLNQMNFYANRSDSCGPSLR